MSEVKEKRGLPDGALDESQIPSDYTALDNYLIDEIVTLAALPELSPLHGTSEATKTVVKWQSIGEKNGVNRYWAKGESNANYYFKGVGEIPAPPALLEEAMRVPANMKIMDPMCRHTETVKTYDRNHHIYAARFYLGPLIWDRDFSWFCLDANLKDGTYVSTGKSIVSKDYPEKPKETVRGEIRASGYVVQPIKDKPESCLLTYVVQSDPKGWLPSSIVNYVAQSQAYNPGVIKEKIPVFLKMREDAAKNAKTTEEKEKK